MSIRNVLHPVALIIAVALLTSWPTPASAQEGVYEIVEVLQDFPADLKSNEVWTIGGQRFQSTKSTIRYMPVAAEKGTLVKVHFTIAGDVAQALRIELLGINATRVTDGPYVIWKDKQTAEVITFDYGNVKRDVIENIFAPMSIDGLSRAESSITLDPNPPTPPAAIWPAPQRLLAISDLEGNYDNAMRFLENNKVLDDEGHWDWGDGHLVLIGDLVDRGSQVTEVMWLVRRLEWEAELAGGRVHYILGNHEAMVMVGDLRYIHDKYRFVSQRMKTPYNELYGPDSEIGRWWRTKNGVEVIGDLLFVHGGYSPILDQYDLDIDTLNRRIRDSLHPGEPADPSNPGSSPVYHMHGPFWYRGYFGEHASEWGGKATSDEIDRILMRHNAKHIVIGHTLVNEVGPVDGDERIIGVDIKWADSGKCQGLLVEQGKMWRVKLNGERSELPSGAIK